MNYFFSIVIPVYNAEKYIAEMIESIQQQSYRNWQLILIDDGSTDESGTICDKYKSENISVYHYKNQGQMVARYNGIMKAEGDYTLVVDADDKLDSNCLQMVNDILNKKNYDMVMFPFICCDEKLVSKKEVSAIPNQLGEMNQKEVLYWVIETYNHGLVNKIIKTNLIKKGAEEAPKKKLKVNGDYALIIPILCHIRNAYFLNEPLYFYRVYGESTSHNYTFQHILDTDYVSNNVVGLLKKYNLCDEKTETLVYLAYLRMIAWMLEELVIQKKLKKRDFDQIKKLTFYQESLKYEIRSNFGHMEYIELKIIRAGRFYLTALIRDMVKAKNFLRVIYHKIMGR